MAAGGGACSPLEREVRVTRGELRNLRQQIDKAVRVHKKSIDDLRSFLSDIKREQIQDSATTGNQDAEMPFCLEKGNIGTVPIGFLESCFSVKNATPRQPTICSLSRARLKISKAVFTNPEHSLIGLDQFSHVWIVFIFHKNGHQSCKAKVKPPRLNGLKTGVFSTRSPHRPNAIGLTLAKLDRIEGDTVCLSGIDMIEGTPVLDIKPYIPDYDTPRCDASSDGKDSQFNKDIVLDEQFQTVTNPVTGEYIDEGQVDTNGTSEVGGGCFAELGPNPPIYGTHSITNRSGEVLHGEDQHLTKVEEIPLGCELKCEKDNQFAATKEAGVDQSFFLTVEKIRHQLIHSDIATESTDRGKVISMELKDAGTTMYHQYQHQPKTSSSAGQDLGNEPCISTVAAWVKESPVSSLDVRFTPYAEKDLEQFQAPDKADPGKTSLKHFQSIEEARSAIMAILSADPRSVYRRKQCQDQLFYFTLDSAHITCWFGGAFAEILRIKPVKEKKFVTE
ncbi:tRNA (adenine(37)-N6)-methyltransferase [Callorhinchus milii]|uniref:tRNA (adenine(37)-N6)-methyltransferase n=1 Tax=Callorhinchus milii TaxID=7868 RepID=UPI001C3F9F3A|nr:tRNA (adenine(37)-N6)-methyltransferase [Callorhinchus milii]